MTIVVENYTFDASAKTITLLGLSAVSLAGMKIITNITDGIIIYQFNSPTKGGTLAGNVLTLEYDTTAMDDADTLMILYDNPGDGELTTRVDEVTTYTYIGYSNPGASEASAVWRIKRMTNATGSVVFADGNTRFDNVWADRASLTYS